MVGCFTYAAVIGLPMVEATNLASFNKIVRLGKLLKLIFDSWGRVTARKLLILLVWGTDFSKV